MRCEMRITATPLAFTWRMVSITIAASRTPSAAVGSSMISTRGLKTSARPIATVWRWPPDSALMSTCVDGMREPRSASSRAASSCMRLQVEHAEAARLAAEEEVARDIEIVAERQVLVDHLDAGGARIPRRREGRAPAVDQDLAAVGLLRAGEDLHQRRFAGAVVAEDAEHFAGMDGEVDGTEGGDGAVGLRDPANLDPRGPPVWLSHQIAP